MNTLMIKRLPGALLLLLALALPVAANEFQVTESRLQVVSASIKRQIEDGNLAGAVMLVAQHGELKHLEAMGYQSLEERIPMETDSIFRIYSMTKPIAGTALMILHDQGRFKLDDPVEKYIPEFKDLQVASADGPNGIPVTVPAAHPMTIRELMSHSAGLTYGYFSKSQVDTLYAQAEVLDRDSSLQEMVNKLAKIPLWGQPGARWHYSVAVDVQAYLIEVLSGMPFDHFLAEYVFAPLKMHDTGFYVPLEKKHRFARYYGADASGKLVSKPNQEYFRKPGLLSGGGGLVSTAEDYLRFAQMHLNGGELEGTRILSQQAVDLMRSNQLPQGVLVEGPMAEPANGFGLDFSVLLESKVAYGQPAGNYYWWGIAGTWFWIDPSNELIFIGMIQNRDVAGSVGLHRTSKHLMYAP
jgi:CubicO group peptidase (beta-lactamase class C family)